MARKLVGIDIGYEYLKLVLMAGKKVKKSVVVEMPDRMLRQGRVVSVDAMGELIRETMKKNRIHCSQAAILLSNESVFIRNVVMPIMTADQLVYNLPFEFRDYITDELKNYVFDYAMQTKQSELLARAAAAPETKKEESEGGEKAEEPVSRSMELLAVAAPVELMDELRDMTRKAGMHLAVAAPAVCAYSGLLAKAGIKEEQECCILDLGHQSIRMYMFKGDCHKVTRELEFGIGRLEEIVAENYNVDEHLAHTYLISNHENCQMNEACAAFYSSTAVELMRAVNFYQFSNPDSHLETMYLCGGGVQIAPLIESIGQTLNLELKPASALLYNGEKLDDCDEILQAAGIAME